MGERYVNKRDIPMSSKKNISAIPTTGSRRKKAGAAKEEQLSSVIYISGFRGVNTVNRAHFFKIRGNIIVQHCKKE